MGCDDCGGPEYHHASSDCIASLRAEVERLKRLWSEDRAAVKDWAAASDAIGELYEILGITKDSAGFEDGFTKIVAAAKMLKDLNERVYHDLGKRTEALILAESRLSLAEKAVEAARNSIHDCTCKDGVTFEYVDGMPVAEISCPYCGNLRAALLAYDKEGG